MSASDPQPPAPVIPPQISAAINGAMERVVMLFMSYIGNAVEPTRADDPDNIAGAVQAVEDALRRIEFSLAAHADPQPPAVSGLTVLFATWREKAIESIAESSRIRSVHGGTEAESNCLVRAALWRKCADEAERAFTSVDDAVARLTAALEWQAACTKSLLPYQDRAVKAEAEVTRLLEELQVYAKQWDENKAAADGVGITFRLHHGVVDHHYERRIKAESDARRLREERDAQKVDYALLDLITRSKSLCGHWGSHAYSPDGKGKHIICLDCEVASLRATLAATEEKT